MWQDLQEAFFIVAAPFIRNILLPGFLAAGILLALKNFLSRLFSVPTDTEEGGPYEEMD